MEKNKLIIITGASGGLGLNILKYFSTHHKVLAIYNKNKPKFINSNITYLRIDFLKKIKINIKYLNFQNIVLINLASIKKDGLLINYSLKNWRDVFKVNVESNFEITKIILKQMINNKWGRVINFSSSDGSKGDVGTAAYTSSKLAIHGINKVISKEYAKFNITSNVLLLGNFNFGMFKSLSHVKQNELLNKVPSKKHGHIKNIYNAIEFIINSDYVNNSEIKIDGGL
ncbi:SDR family NAD(P)-dependent oxidoreductase [Candidatus Pelagibacter bacterium]|nr:SDR family NAD(P)-dependent oxidoreductase [Candidatus Pelagibacter bacterium]|tara:strand:+ start:6864 stop:7547 length:684 start_codon:yes stop_codon:yes gene_type:complete